eukprot:1317254-Prymnesium_polylepis.1
MPWALPVCARVRVHHARVPVITCHLADRESSRRGRIRRREIGCLRARPCTTRPRRRASRLAGSLVAKV